MSNEKALLGLLAGVSIGAVLGILFAPGKGSSTRKKIAHRSDEYLTDLGDKFDEFVAGLTHKMDAAKAEAIRLAENGKAKVDEVEGKIVSALK